jgi:hypothetical protein
MNVFYLRSIDILIDESKRHIKRQGKDTKRQ